MNLPVPTIGVILRALAGAVAQPGLFGDKAAKLAPYLNTLGSLAELPEHLAPERAALLEQINRWTTENRGPTDEELDAFRTQRNDLDAKLRAARDSLSSTVSKLSAFVGTIALCVLLGLHSEPARAAGTSSTLSWTLPTAYEDGSAIAAGELKETIIQWRRPGNATVVGSVHVAVPAVSTVVQGLTCGNFEFTGIAVVKTNNVTSSETAPVVYATGIQCRPNPPGGLGAS